MTPREKNDVPYIIAAACLGVVLVVAIVVFWR
jgi:hypothetical protein